MKKNSLLFILLLTMASFSVNGQNKEWNFSDATWASADVKSGVTVDNLTNYSINAKAAVSSSKKTYTLNGTEYSFTSCFKFGENGSFEEDQTPKTGVIAFNVNGDTEISVVGVHASSSGAARELVVAAKGESELVELGYFTAYSTGDTSAPEGLNGQLNSGTFNYKGDANTLYVYSRNGGVNLYLIKTTQMGANSIIESVLDKEIKTIELYDLSGKRLPNDSKGVLMQKTIYVDDSSSISKIFKN